MEERQFENQVCHAMKRPLADLQAELARTNRSMPRYRMIQTALTRLEDQRQLAEQGVTERRHAESISETRASRRLDKWAFGVAGSSLILSAVSVGIAIVALRQSPSLKSPAPVLPSPPSSVPAGRADPISGIDSKISTPTTVPLAPRPTKTPDEELKALPPSPSE